MEREGDDRRSFLKHIVAGTAAVAVTAAMIKPATSKSLPAACRPPESLYHESEYFKQYYNILRS